MDTKAKTIFEEEEINIEKFEKMRAEFNNLTDDEKIQHLKAQEAIGEGFVSDPNVTLEMIGISHDAAMKETFQQFRHMTLTKPEYQELFNDPKLGLLAKKMLDNSLAQIHDVQDYATKTLVARLFKKVFQDLKQAYGKPEPEKLNIKLKQNTDTKH